ncbi:SdpA family antimicrobial peptide system protein [Micromonospora lutea]|uniref:SdpA family antimicrobial peptide system protein n=1 Tax=Micromonospora lutea TaxID=419825 RepID=A0ABQ4J210_9ACTN|nr:SdpA family antimicrobial peptide system protein [Micromonospora lutea]GIJ24189.1 hypothetical protein Vlu01_48130 [Micromonospora lutea]
MTSDGTNRVRVSPRLVGSITLILVLLAAYDLQAFLPANVVRLPYQDAVSGHLRPVLPQGWAFFTKSARSEDVEIYALTGGSLRNVSAGALAEPRNAFGLNRKARAQGPEMATLVQQLRSEAWQPCTDDVLSCARESSTTRMRNAIDAPTICGDIVFVRTEPVPWAYRDLVPDEKRATFAARAEVSC